MGKIQDFIDVIVDGKADAVAVASVIHYDIISLADIRKQAIKQKIPLRKIYHD